MHVCVIFLYVCFIRVKLERDMYMIRKPGGVTEYIPQPIKTKCINAEVQGGINDKVLQL